RRNAGRSPVRLRFYLKTSFPTVEILMAYFVYIIYSIERDRFYVGYSENVQQRIEMHRIRKNLGASDWQLKHAEEFSSRSEAMKREAAIKARKSRTYIESLFMPSG
ncbi:MAG: hypothetical protein RLZZ630_234, partial [Bacteroidota bacterium]